jgi:hypothetical protein
MFVSRPLLATSLILRASRALISYATSLHLSFLRGTLRSSDRRVALAAAAVHTAKQVADAAVNAQLDAVEARRDVERGNKALRVAVNAEAQSLRKGTVLA